MKKEGGATRINLAEQAEAVQAVLHKAVQHAIWTHKRLGNPIAVWKDGRVVIIPPEEIVLSSEFPQQKE